MSECVGFRVVTAVGEKRVGRVVGSQGDYCIVKRSFGRGRYPLPKRQAVVDSEKRRVLMRVPRKMPFEASQVRRNGELDPANGWALQRLTLLPEAPGDSLTAGRRVPRARRTRA